MFSLGRLYETEARSGSIPGRSILHLEVPVNMRRLFPSQTMRNFSLYVSPEADMRLGPYSFEELLSRVHRRMQMEVDRRELGRQITPKVGTEHIPVIRITPLFVKDIFLGWVYRHLSDRIYSGVLSNFGGVEVPEEMAKHIESFGMVLPPTEPWFLTLAPPLTVLAGALIGGVSAVVRALRPRVFAIRAVVLACAGLFLVGLEITINLYLSGAFRLSWSLVVFGCIAPLVGLLLYVQYRLKVTSDDLGKIFHL